ncbi:MAG TPA: hypothetical protein VHH52_06305, partial [Pseudonocardiaceae bacterium]|nr:hypothetical protein [Pseudonocardiaceae bacterium]
MLGSYRERPAPAGLAGVVACVWRNEITAARELWRGACRRSEYPSVSGHHGSPAGSDRATVPPWRRPRCTGGASWALRDQRLRLEDLWPGTAVSLRIAEMHNPAAGLAAAVAARVTEPDLALSAVLRRLQTGF